MSKENRNVINYESHNKFTYNIFFAFLALLIVTLWHPIIRVHAKDSNKNYIKDNHMDSESVGVTIRYGLEQEARYGRNLLVTIEIHSVDLQGSYDFNLNFCGTDNQNVKYGKSVNLKYGETTKFNLSIPMTKKLSSFKAELRNDKNHTVVEQVFPLNVDNYGTYKLIGILSDTPQSLSYFESFGSKCYYLDETNFPNDKDGLDLLDIIVINDFDTSTLNVEQLQALKEFVSLGGTVVIGTGSEISKTLNHLHQNGLIDISGITDSTKLSDVKMVEETIRFTNEENFRQLTEEISRYENERINIMNRLEELKKTKGVITPDVYIGDSIINNTLVSELKAQSFRKKIAVFDVTNASRYFVDKGIPLVQKLNYQKGNFLISSFSLSMDEKIEEGKVVNTNYLSLVKMIFDNMNPARLDRLEMESYGNSYFSPYGSFVRYTEEKDTPGIFGFLAILIVYIIIIGPVTFILLKKLDISKYIWGIVPVLSVLFVIIVYLAGASTRIQKPFVNYLNVETYNPQTMQVDGELDFELSFPTNDESQVELPGVKQIKITNDNIPAYYFYYNNKFNNSTYVDSRSYKTGIYYKGSGVQIERVNSPAFSKTKFQTTYSTSFKPQMDAQITINEKEIEGTISNLGEESYKNSYILYRGNLLEVGSLEPGVTIQLSQCKKEYFMNQEMVYRSKLMESLLEYKSPEEVTPKSQSTVSALQSVLSKLLEDNEYAYFISYKEELNKNNPIYELSKNKASHGVHISLIPFEVSLEEENSQLVPSMDPYMQVIEGEYQAGFNYRYLISDNLVLDYNLPKDDKITEILLSEFFNHTIKSNYSSMICEEVLFYNNQTHNYDTVFRMNEINTKEYNENKPIIQRINGDNLKKYLTEDNKLRVKFKSGATMDNLAILPYISYRKEVSYAADKKSY